MRMSSLCRLLQRSFCTSTAPQVKPRSKVLAGELYRERSVEQLFEKFKKSCENSQFRNNGDVYKRTVSRLASAGRLDLIEGLLEHQKKYPTFSREGFGARLIYLYGRSGMFDHAHKLFEEMPKRGLLSFNALLGACLSSKKFDKVDGLFKELPEKFSIKPDLVSYNTVIKAYCEKSSLVSAILMLDEMERKGVEPDLITFNTLLDGFYRNGQLDEGEKIWSRMVEKNISPDCRSYNAKLLGLVTAKRTSEGVQLIKEMQEKGIKRDVFSFNLLIKGYVNEGMLEEAKHCYMHLRKAGCAPDKVTFTLLLPFLRQKGDLEFAFKLCERILNRRWPVDVTVLQSVLDELVKASKIEEAKKLVKLADMKKLHHYGLKVPSEK